jgi:hypothetical protein
MKNQKQNQKKQAVEANTQDGGKVEEGTSQAKTQKTQEDHKRQVVAKNVAKQRQA